MSKPKKYFILKLVDQLRLTAQRNAGWKLEKSNRTRIQGVAIIKEPITGLRAAVIISALVAMHAGIPCASLIVWPVRYGYHNRPKQWYVCGVRAGSRKHENLVEPRVINVLNTHLYLLALVQISLRYCCGRKSTNCN